MRLLRSVLLNYVPVLAVFAALANGQTSSSAVETRGWNDELLRVHEEMQRAPRAGRESARGQAAGIIGKRAAALHTLIKEDPAQAMRMAFSAELLADLADKFPASASRLEKHGTWQGLVEYRIYDGADGSHWSQILMTVGSEQVQLHFAGPEPANLSSGDVVEATGILLGSDMAVSSGITQPISSAKMTSRAAAGLSCSTTGVQNTAVLLLNLPNAPLPSNITQPSMQDMFFSTTTRSMDGYFRETSYGRTSASGNVFGPYTLTGSYAGCGTSQMQNDAIAAASAAGVNLKAYTRLFMVFPDNIGCGWAGMGTMGCSTVSAPSGSFTASSSYVAAGYANVQVATHEAGHNLRLQHAQTRDFGTEALGPMATPGTLSEYGDEFSTMGNWIPGHYAAPQKAGVLGWMTNGTDYQIVQTSGTYTIQPLETNSGMRALKVQRGTGNNAWLWIEYRQPTGNYDTSFNTTQPYSGAVIHYEDSTTGAYSQLLDFTPGSDSNDFGDPALVAGKTWVDPYTNVSLTVDSVTASALNVTVNYGATPCTHANPGVSISPLNPSVTAGGSVNYTLTLVNNDSAGCQATSFTSSAALPAGWTPVFSSPVLTVNPGQSGSTTMTVSAPASAVPGTYPVGASASAGSFTGAVSANCTVVAAPVLMVTLSLPGSNFARRSTVPITATVLNGGSPAAGASVVLTLAKPDGSSATKTLSTDSTGNAVWSYKLAQRDPVGTYTVSAQASSSAAQTAAAAVVSFAVQ